MPKEKQPRKFVASAPGYLNKYFVKGETVPEHLVPNGGAGWIVEILEDGTRKPSTKTMKKSKKKKAKSKAKPVTKPVNEPVNEADPSEPEQSEAETSPYSGGGDITINDAYLALDPADDSHWNADGSVGIRNLNKLNGSKFSGDDLGEDMNREALTLLKSDG